MTRTITTHHTQTHMSWLGARVICEVICPCGWRDYAERSLSGHADARRDAEAWGRAHVAQAQA